MRYLVFIGILGLCAPAVAQEGDWVPVTGAETLREFMSGLTAERTLPGGGVNRAEYYADGTGVLHSWGASFRRTWEVEGDEFAHRIAASVIEIERAGRRTKLRGTPVQHIAPGCGVPALDEVYPHLPQTEVAFVIGLRTEIVARLSYQGDRTRCYAYGIVLCFEVETQFDAVAALLREHGAA